MLPWKVSANKYIKFAQRYDHSDFSFFVNFGHKYFNTTLNMGNVQI